MILFMMGMHRNCEKTRLKTAHVVFHYRMPVTWDIIPGIMTKTIDKKGGFRVVASPPGRIVR